MTSILVEKDTEIELEAGMVKYCNQVFGSVMATAGNGGVILNIASDLSVIAPD